MHSAIRIPDCKKFSTIFSIYCSRSLRLVDPFEITSMDLNKKTGHLGALMGNYNQMRFLMWIYQRLADGDSFPQYKDFELTTEMEAAKPYDDAVVKWVNTDDEQNWLFIQAKHHLTSEKMTEEFLFSENQNNDYSLYKYFQSFLDIEQNENFKGNKRYVIFTNCDVDNTILKYFDSVENEAAEVLKNSTSAARLLKLKVKNNVQLPEAFEKMGITEREKSIISVNDKNEEEEDLEIKLFKYCNKDLNSLAETLETIFINPSSKVSTDIIEKYRGAILQKILNIVKEKPSSPPPPSSSSSSSKEEKEKVVFMPNFIGQKDLDLSHKVLWTKLCQKISPNELKKCESTDQEIIKILKNKKQSKTKLPPFLDIDKDIKPFVEKAIFAVNQPNYIDLKSIITSELESRHGKSIEDPKLRSYFSTLGSYDLEDLVHKCLGSEKVLYLKKNELLEKLQIAKCDAIQPELDVHTKIFKREMKKHGVKFETPDLPLQQHPLAIITNTQQGLLTSVKLWQVMESNAENMQYRYYSFKNLVSLHDSTQICKMLSDTFENQNTPLYLILQDDGSKIDYSYQSLNIPQLGKTLRLILLTPSAKRAFDFFKDDSILPHKDTTANLSVLTKSSQEMLEKRMINFQGYDIPLNKLPGYNDMRPKIQNEVLEKLILREIISIGPDLPKMEVEHYIPRQIYLPELENYNYDETNQSTAYSEEQFLEAVPELFQQNKIIVLSSIPGMGKSTIWAKLAHIAKKQDGSKWILHIKLQDCSHHLQNRSKLDNLDAVIDFLAVVLSFRSDLEKVYLKNWLQSNHPDKIYMFMDGFDEIWHEHIKQIICMFEILHSKARIFVTTREHHQHTLTKAFGVEARSLAPMSQEDLRELFTTFNLPKSLGISIDELVDKMESASMKLTAEFIGTPLIVNILIEICKPGVGIQGRKVDLDSLDILFLFERFIYCSFYRYHVEKLKLDTKDSFSQQFLGEQNYVYQRFEELHCDLGINYLIWDNFDKSITERIGQLVNSFQEVLSPIIIGSSYKNDLCFIHSSFGELFAAKFWCNYLSLLTDNQIDEHVQEILKHNPERLENVFLKPANVLKIFYKSLDFSELIRTFFFLLVKRHSSTLLHKIIQVIRVFPKIFRWACEENLELLVKRFVPLHPAIVGELNVLYYAVRSNAHGVCNFLIDNGAKVDTEVNGQTALHVAASNNYIDIVELLIKSKANKDATNEDELTPLDLALQNGHTEVVQYLRSVDSQSNLMLKLKWDNITEILDFFAKKDGKTTVPHDFEQIIANLIEDKTLTCSDWQPTLRWALKKNKLRVIRAMHKVGVDVNNCPLRRVVETNNFPLLSTLLGCGANINVTYKEGYTPLLIAIKMRSCFIAKKLLEKGASPIAKLTNGQNVLHVAAMAYCPLFFDKMSWINSIDSKIIKQLVTAGDENGQTPLHLSCNKGCLFAKELIELGADVNSQDKMGRTPLHCAAADGEKYTVKFLVQHQVDLKAVDNQRMTHLDLAAAGQHWDYVLYCIEHDPCLLDSSDALKCLDIARRTAIPKLLSIPHLNHRADDYSNTTLPLKTLRKLCRDIQCANIV